MSTRYFEQRLDDVRRFYKILDELEERVGGKRTLAEAHGRMGWPERGVYFFFEPLEKRTTSGDGLRVVRVGTHGLKKGSRSTLWTRLYQHRGTLSGKYAGGGKHRSSIFRLHIGTALIERDDWPDEVAGRWGRGSSGTPALQMRELPLEHAVSQHICSMPFLWMEVADEPGPDSLRGYVERNAIALLSNSGVERPIDPPSETWLGRWADRSDIRDSGLWNVNHVAEEYDPAFLDRLVSCFSNS